MGEPHKNMYDCCMIEIDASQILQTTLFSWSKQLPVIINLPRVGEE